MDFPNDINKIDAVRFVDESLTSTPKWQLICYDCYDKAKNLSLNFIYFQKQEIPPA